MWVLRGCLWCLWTVSEAGCCWCRGQLITGCVPVGGVDMCFPGDFDQGSQPCAQTTGGYNMTTFASLLGAGQGADGKEGSLCDPKVGFHPSFTVSTVLTACMIKHP